MYPNLIVDNFFEDPDSIVDLSKNLQYSSSDDGRWPGIRSNYLHRIYPRLKGKTAFASFIRLYSVFC